MSEVTSAGIEERFDPSASATFGKDFDAHFREHIEPHLAALEEKRLKIIAKIRERLIPASIVAIAGFWFFFFVAPQDGGDAVVAYIVAPVLALCAFAWAYSPSMAYPRAYKQTLLPTIASHFGNFSYKIDGGIDLSPLRRSNFLPKHDGYEHEDLFTGTYKDVSVAFCEARLTKVGGKKKTRRKTILGGVFVLLSMNKNFHGQTIVHDVGRMKSWLRNRLGDSLHPVKLEDPEFERRFNVYSDDQVEARYLLTPSFMTRLLELSRTVGQGELEAVFFGSRLLIVLPANSSGGGPTMEMFGKRIGGGKSNLFEPGLLKTSAYETGEIHRIVREFKAILSIVDELKLYEKTRL